MLEKYSLMVFFKTEGHLMPKLNASIMHDTLHVMRKIRSSGQIF